MPDALLFHPFAAALRVRTLAAEIEAENAARIERFRQDLKDSYIQDGAVSKGATAGTSARAASVEERDTAHPTDC